MNKREKIVQEHFLNNEEKVITRLKSVYTQALKDIESKSKALYNDIAALQSAINTEQDAEERARLVSMQQAKIYQKQYQDALKKQVGGILDEMHAEEFRTVSEYLQKCYEDGFCGAMYDLHGQGLPLIFPIDQEAVTRAVQLDSKISKGLYTRLGEDVALLKRKITAQVSRGIATGASFSMVAKQLADYTNIGYNNAVRIARTEGHRIQVQSGMDACYKAQEKGADVVKQWDAALDKRTRESHALIDGEIRELDETFSNGLRYPGDPNGRAEEVINCRCALLQRARKALDADELETLKERAEYFGLDKTANFEDFKQKYLKAAEEAKAQAATFTPAKTKAEAEEFARKFAENVSYKGISLQTANTINERLDYLFGKYGLKAFEAIEPGTKGAMAANYRHLTYNVKKLGKVLEDCHKNFLLTQDERRQSIDIILQRFNGRRLPFTQQNAIDKLREQLNFKRFGVSDLYDDKIAVTVTHEFGHALADQFFGQINKERANPNYREKWALRMTAAEVDKVFNQALKNGDIYKISEYGSKNSHEFFAECFTMYEYGEELPDYINAMLEEVLKNGIM